MVVSFNPAVIHGTAGEVHVDRCKFRMELDLFVDAALVGVRVTGTVRPRGAAFALVANGVEFFEPNEEFGVTKQLEKTEAALISRSVVAAVVGVA